MQDRMDEEERVSEINYFQDFLCNSLFKGFYDNGEKNRVKNIVECI